MNWETERKARGNGLINGYGQLRPTVITRVAALRCGQKEGVRRKWLARAWENGTNWTRVLIGGGEER